MGRSIVNFVDALVNKTSAKQGPMGAKKSSWKERAAVSKWIQFVLASSEKNNFIAKAVDIRSNTPIEFQSVHNSLGVGTSLAQLYRDRAKTSS